MNISTGVVDATVANTIYTDNQLAVYQVDKVLLPVSMFGTPAPATAPAPAKGKKKLPAADGPSSGGDASADASGADGVNVFGSVVVTIVLTAVISAFSL